MRGSSLLPWRPPLHSDGDFNPSAHGCKGQQAPHRRAHGHRSIRNSTPAVNPGWAAPPESSSDWTRFRPMN